MKATGVSQSFITLLFLLFNSVLLAFPDGKLVKNLGQWDSNILYVAFKSNYNLIIDKNGLSFDYFQFESLPDKKVKRGNLVKFILSNANIGSSTEFDKSEWRVNYFHSNDPKKWIKGVFGVKKVVFSEALPKIDLVVESSEENAQYDFVVHPNGNPKEIILKIEGAKLISAKGKEIKILTRFGEVIHNNLLAYQNIGSFRKEVECSFKQVAEDKVSFEVGEYDKTRKLIIDPTVLCSFFGGSADEEFVDMVEISTGILLTTGWTESVDFPTSSGMYDIILNGGKEVFISKFDVRGSTRKLLFTTFLGGGAIDYPVNIAVDGAGFVYVGGNTNSSDFPLVNSITTTINGQYDIFGTKLTPNCDSLIFSTFIGGNKDDIATSAKLAGDKGLYFTGYTNSTNFPVAGSAYQTKLQGKNDIFFLRLSNTGQTIRNATYIGGTDDDQAYSMVVTPSETVFIVGATKSGDFPVFPVREWYSWVIQSPYDRSYNGGWDAVAIKIYGNGGAVDYASFFGGVADDFARAVSYYGADEKIVFAGETYKEPTNITFPLTQNAYQKTIKGQAETFVASLTNIIISSQYGQVYKSQDLIFSTFLGGVGNDIPTGIIYNEAIQKFIVSGNTNSTNFPIADNPSGKKIGKYDVYYVSMLNDGSALSFSDLYGGIEDDFARTLILTKYGDYYIAGQTKSTTLPVVNPIEGTKFSGQADGFLMKVSPATLRLDAPFGKEELCPNTNLTIRWSSEGLTSSDTFDLEIKNEPESEWKPLASNVVGSFYTFSIPSTLLGKVWFRITHKRGLIATIAAPVTILELPKIVQTGSNPQNLQICEGDSVQFWVQAKGSRLKYQWKYNNTNFINGNDSLLVLRNLEESNSGNYKVVVSGACEPPVESPQFLLDVIPATRILYYSADTTVKKDTKLVLNVYAKGRDLTYQWYKNGFKLLGENGNTFTIDKVSKSDEGKYKCVVTGICQSDSTSEIQVDVDTTITAVIDSKLQFSVRILSLDNSKIEVEIISDKANVLSLQMANLLGQYVFEQKTIEVVPGKNKLLFDVSSFDSGYYYLVFSTGKELRVVGFPLIR
jgi:hypothetical protein